MQYAGNHIDRHFALSYVWSVAKMDAQQELGLLSLGRTGSRRSGPCHTSGSRSGLGYEPSDAISGRKHLRQVFASCPCGGVYC